MSRTTVPDFTIVRETNIHTVGIRRTDHRRLLRSEQRRIRCLPRQSVSPTARTAILRTPPSYS